MCLHSRHSMVCAITVRNAVYSREFCDGHAKQAASNVRKTEGGIIRILMLKVLSQVAGIHVFLIRNWFIRN